MIPYAAEIESLWQQTLRSRRAYRTDHGHELADESPDRPEVTGMEPGDPRHGKRSGYGAHRQYGEEACQPCKDANNAYYRQRRDQRRTA